MKRAKKITKRQRKELLKNQSEITETVHKTHKTEPIFSLTRYLQKQAEKKRARMHERSDKRNTKPLLEKAVLKAAKEAKQAKKAARDAKRATQEVIQ